MRKILSLTTVVMILHVVTLYDAAWGQLPPQIHVVDWGNVAHDRFPVSGGIPFPRGALLESDLADLVVTEQNGTPVPVQLQPTARWPDGSVKWLLLDFPSTQAAGDTAVYSLVRQSKGPLRDYLENIPIYLMTGKHPALLGAASWFYDQKSGQKK